MSSNFSSAKAIPIPEKVDFVAQRSAPLWQCGLVFAFGFALEFNPTIGLGGQAAASGNLFGFRVIDVISFGAVCLLGIYSLVPKRILPLAFYALIIGILFAAPILSTDPQTSILAYRYMLYSLAALYVLVVVDEVAALEWFCWGLIIGLIATVPIFIVQDSVYASKLVEWGLTPPYANVAFTGSGGDFLRYSGLTGHPNEAGHVAALSAAAGAYFLIARRRLLPIAIVSAGLLVIFYYARSRGGLFAGGAIVSLSLIVAQGRINLIRFVVVLSIVGIVLVLISQLDFIASRFGNDQDQSTNISERLGSMLAAVHVILTNPLGLPLDEFSESVASESGGMPTPHNGFLFFGGVFGLLPLLVLLVAFGVSLRVRDETDVFFAFFALQVGLSFLFEQLPGTCSYEFAICLLIGHTYLKTGFGTDFRAGFSHRAFQRSLTRATH